MIFFLIGASTALAQVQNQPSEDRSRPAPVGAGRPAGVEGQGGTAPSLRGSAGGSSVQVIPMISISGRYDSNVFYSPVKTYDYVTSIRPGARVMYRDDLVEGSLLGNLTSEVYARNPELNYLGVNGTLNLSLDNLAGRLIRGLGLRVMDYVAYTPQAQAFLTPEAPADSSFLRGIQAYRNNSLMHTANVQGVYAISPLAQFNSGYSYQTMKFFNQTIPGVTGVGGTLYNTAVQSVSAGPEYRMTSTQSVGSTYQYTQMVLEPSTGVGASSSFSTHSIMATWRSSFTRELTAEISPGVSLVSNLPQSPQWTMRGLLGWSDGKTTGQVLYSRGIFPSFFQVATVFVSDLVTVSASQVLNSEWSISAASSYAHGRSVGPQSFDSDSLNHTVGVSYIVSPGIVASLSGIFSKFTYGVAGANTQFERQAVTLSLTAEWN